MNNRFFNKDSTITAYAFCCGYVEKYGTDDIPRATISREPNDYHVKGFDREGFHFWEVFDTVKEARSFARKTAGKLKVKTRI